MGKHSFAPKLNNDEYELLRLFSREWSTWGDYSPLPLSRRGLLEYRPTAVVENFTLKTRREFRLTRRGELTLARYQKVQTDRDWREKAVQRAA